MRDPLKLALACGALVLPFSVAFTACRAAQSDPPPVQTVAQVEIPRYLGKWYEIARYPRFFQKQCVSDVSAQYAPRKDGRVEVTNRCRKRDGSIDEARGVAEVVDGSNNTKLEVTFMPPFSGDYWIIGLDQEYRWSIVASPNRRSLWILSRTPSLDKKDLDSALRIIRTQGFALDKLQYTSQDNP
ncbi:lipocalin family protein [Bordetella sp. LUAb4]|uniref:lipocalin family protein n=1 Tax=Bordetella sp. LUAb4 TaxID=2843195 RepID=UPI001E3D3900|nr:lipocalin family protein [Bordetella sp. LUAb4]